MYCGCIEKDLPSIHKGALDLLPDDQIQNKQAVVWSPASDSEALEAKLKEYGLLGYQIELLLARFSEGKTLNQISKEFSWLSPNTAHYHLRKALQDLKDRKFK